MADNFNACLTQGTFVWHYNHMVSLLSHLVIPKWAKWMSRLSQSASPIVLVIASSAVRGIQLSREASEFRSGCTTAKLFAKHLKVCMYACIIKR